GSDRLLHVFDARGMEVSQHVPVVVRHDGVLDASRANLASADDDGNLDLLTGHRLQPCFQLGALGRAWQVCAIRIVHGRRYATNGCDCSLCGLGRGCRTPLGGGRSAGGHDRSGWAGHDEILYLRTTRIVRGCLVARRLTRYLRLSFRMFNSTSKMLVKYR